ncbi:MAG: peroxiredoxin [Pseudomonadota bacterium]
MAISVGDQLPEATLLTMVDGEPSAVSAHAVLGSGRAVLFSMPGAFTGTCSAVHLPNVIHYADRILAKGIDTIAVMTVNDPFALYGWGEANGTPGTGVVLLADPEAKFADQVGLTFDLPERGLVHRSQRYSMVIRDGIIEHLNVDVPGPTCEISGGERILELI